jgi:hypothetical protein
VLVNSRRAVGGSVSPKATANAARCAAGIPASAGTPKTIDEAIARGFAEIEAATYFDGPLPEPERVLVVRRHVKDFLAQHFTVAMISEDHALSSSQRGIFERLWSTLFPPSGQEGMSRG